MIIKEKNKINHKPIFRYTSDKNYYIKIKDSDKLLTEVVSEEEVKVIETNEKIEVEEVEVELEEND